MIKNTVGYLDDIRKCAERIVTRVPPGSELSLLSTDEDRTWVIERLLIILGEAAWKLPRLERGQFNGVPWNQIAALRHRLVHSYDGTDVGLLHSIAVKDVPQLQRNLDWTRPTGRAFPFPIKICGLSTPDTMEAALDAGADMIGLNFHPRSPRYVSAELAAELAVMARGRALVVALAVDPSDDMLDGVLAKFTPDVLQLHGSETPERLAEITARHELPVMKALGVAEADDLAVVKAFRPGVDRLLLDAKPPKDAAYPGGHGKTFDWTLLKGLDPFMPFMLSGGLTADNVGEAIRSARAMGVTLAGVDVSSGVESAPGVKDAVKMRDFIAAARAAV